MVHILPQTQENVRKKSPYIKVINNKRATNPRECQKEIVIYKGYN
jgi:hypothetical protein